MNLYALQIVIQLQVQFISSSTYLSIYFQVIIDFCR